MTDHPFPAPTRAAEAAIAYRRDVAAAEWTPAASHAAMLDASPGPLPGTGDDGDGPFGTPPTAAWRSVRG